LYPQKEKKCNENKAKPINFLCNYSNIKQQQKEINTKNEGLAEKA
jgi:hypothetical protein